MATIEFIKSNHQYIQDELFYFPYLRNLKEGKSRAQDSSELHCMLAN